MEKLKVRLLHADAQVPKRATQGSIGLDIFAYVPESTLWGHTVRSQDIDNGHVSIVRTGIAIEVPNGYYARIAPRSGLAVKNGIHVMAGVIDPDYRGEVMIALTKVTRVPEYYTISHGDRIAQLILERADMLETEVIEIMSDTARGSGGFGST